MLMVTFTRLPDMIRGRVQPIFQFRILGFKLECSIADKTRYRFYKKYEIFKSEPAPLIMYFLPLGFYLILNNQPQSHTTSSVNICHPILLSYGPKNLMILRYVHIKLHVSSSAYDCRFIQRLH